MNFTVLERLLLLNLLPAQGSILTLRVVQQLKTDLSFSEEEIARLSLKELGANITWNQAVEEPKCVEVGDKGKEIIASALRALDEAEQLQPQHLSLWERFMEVENV